ncbi:uncharacterized protein [Dermacentor albipictus]|uniref:uncharacterized protein n=1 Tax=Dermacentor albipictus TaxID=60249 RepID=UPI0038FC7322
MSLGRHSAKYSSTATPRPRQLLRGVLLELVAADRIAEMLVPFTMLHYNRSADESLTRCTHGASSGRCVIFQELQPLNIELGKLALELQESAPGLLTLTAAVRYGDFMVRNYNVSCSVGHLLNLVLRSHHCIVSVDVDFDALYVGDNISIVEIIVAKVKSLVSLRLRNMFTTKERLDSLASVLHRADNLHELHLQNSITLNRKCALLFQALFRSADRLTALSIANVHVDPLLATQLLEGLAQNSSIHTLSASTCACFHGIEHGAPLVTAIARRQALKSLKLERCCFQCEGGVKSLMKALAANRCLSTLSLSGFGFAIAFQELMPALLYDNDALQTLSIDSHYYYNNVCCWRYGPLICTGDQLGRHTAGRLDLDLLSEGISKNIWLEELTIDLSTSEPWKCQRFFKTLRENTTLRRVIVTNVIYADAGQICSAIRQDGLQDRVTLMCQLVVREPLEAVAMCTNISTVVIDYIEPPNWQLLERVLILLPQWQHITELYLGLPSEQLVSGYVHFQSYLLRTTKLRNLNLIVVGRVVERNIRRNLAQTLLLNRSLRKLSVVGEMVVDAHEAQEVAQMLCGNATLCEFSFFGEFSQEGYDPVTTATILRYMAPHITKNHALCSLKHGPVPYSANLHAVHNVVRRNRALVMRAARFVVGTDRSDYCAEALNLVWHCP